MIARAVGPILGLEVVKGVRRFESDHGERLLPEHGAGVFSPLNPTLGEDQCVVTACRAPGIGECGPVLDARHPDARTLVNRLDHERKAQRLGTGQIGLRAQQHRGGRRQAAARPSQLAAVLVHAQRRAQHTGARVGHPDGLERALDLTVFPAAPVQDDEGAIEAAGAQMLQNALVRIQRMGVDALAQQGGQHGTAALERDLTLRRPPAEEHRDLAEPSARLNFLRCHGCSPAICLTSGTSLTPVASSTRRCTRSISSRMSAALAAPVLMMKFACFSDT